jgi:hypothetical protein
MIRRITFPCLLAMLAAGCSLSAESKQDILLYLGADYSAVDNRAAQFEILDPDDKTTAGTNTPGLVFYSSCNNRRALEFPRVGLPGTLSGEPVFIKGRIGRAYLVTPDRSGALAYPGAVVPAGRGTIELWARLVRPPRTVPWHNAPGLFRAEVPGGGQYMVAFNGNDGWGGGGVTAWAGNGNAATGDWTGSYAYADLLGGAPEGWHHYALLWDAEGLPGSDFTMQLYLVGRPVGTPFLCGEDHRATGFGQPAEFLLGHIQDTFPDSAVALDDVRIWDFPRVPDMATNVPVTYVPVSNPVIPGYDPADNAAAQVETADAQATPAAPGLVFWTTFNNKVAVLTPAHGAGGSLAAEATFAAGRTGRALVVTTPDSAILAYPGSIVPANRGSIEVWAKLVNPPVWVPWHNSPYFFAAPAGDYGQYVLGYNGNDGWGGGGLVAWAGDGNMASGNFYESFTYAGILGGAVEGWHHYRVSWDSAGIPGTDNRMLLYLDGQPVGTSAICGEDHRPDDFPQPLTFLVGHIQDNFGGSAVLLDDLKIWNYAKAGL